MGLKTQVRDAIYEESSFDIEFDVLDKDDGPVTPSSLKVYVFLDEDATDGSPTYINSRDGTDGTGLTNSANTVSLHLSPDDNQIQNSEAAYEYHRIAIEVFYNADADKDIFEWLIKVENRAYAT